MIIPQSKKNIIAAILLVFIVSSGIFLRVFHFSDWLHFELDQSRDAKLIEAATEEGITSLPLLGPRAGGTSLRLGPAFYYIEYIGAKIAGATPQGVASSILFFGILAIPMFYFFSRRYFDRWITLGLLAIFSTSLFLILYSRFAWNPNPLPFFILATFYALLRSADREEKRPGLWLMAAAAFMSITTQFHFLAFLAIPAIVVLFLAVKRPRIRIRYWIAAFLIGALFYIPVAINDFQNNGANAKELIRVISGKSEKNKKTLLSKTIRNITEESSGYFLILSGQVETEAVRLNQTGFLFFDTACDGACRHDLPLILTAIALFLSGITLMVYGYFKEKNARRKDFLLLSTLWFCITFILFTPIAYDISPRFFLLIAGLPFLFLGFLLEFVKDKIGMKKGTVALFLIVSLFVFSNGQKTLARFQELEKAPAEGFKPEPDRILKERHRVTLIQQKKIMEYIYRHYDENHFPVYLNSDPQYRRSFLYFLDERNIPRDDFRNVVNVEKVFEHGNYFLIYPTVSNTETELRNYEKNFIVSKTTKFGTLTVFMLDPRPEAITDIEQIFKKENKPDSLPGINKRFTWEEILSGDDDEEEEL